MCVAEKVAYICAMIFSRIRARLRLHRIVMKRIEIEDEEWNAFMEQVYSSLRQGNNEGCASDKEGDNADPKASRRSFRQKKLSCITARGTK